MNLEQVMTAIASDMRTQLEVFTAQYKHRGLRGAGREDVVREFLENYLPSNVEITTGEIFDTEQRSSPESEIIVIDRVHVPLMFARSKRLVPIEGVYSVLEVKTNLNSRELKDCLGKCDTIKSLEKRAFYPEISPIKYTTNVYGQELEHFPTLFSVFAYRSIKSETIARQVEEWCNSRPPEKTVDSIVCLNSWVLCWQDKTSGDYDLTSSPNAQLTVVESGKNSLLLFYLLYYRWLSHASTRPIRMTDYTKGAPLGFPIYPPLGLPRRVQARSTE